MNFRNVALLGLAALLLLAAALMVEPTAAQDGPNLLENPGFEAGHYNQDGIAEIAVPNGWRMHWLDGVTFAGSEGPAYRPETVVWNIAGAPPEEEDLFWKDGAYTLKVFKGWAPLYAALSQDVEGLEVGRRYRLVAPIYIDIVSGYDAGKVPPDDPTVGQVRLGASPTGAAWRDANAITYSGWWTGATTSPFYLNYPIFVHDFTATQANMTVWIEFASKKPMPNNGFFMDTMGLYALDEYGSVTDPAASNRGAAAVPAATPTPLPPPEPRADGSVVHVVQSGDTLWTLAIQYADWMELPPQDALAELRTLNNEPAFLNPGDELLVLPPSAERATETEADAAEAEAPAEEGDAAEEDTAVEGEAVEADAPAEGADVIADNEGETEEDTAVAEAGQTEPADAATISAICVSVFDDENGNGTRQSAEEGLLADAAVTVTRAGETLATYVSDGLSDRYCFQDLEPDTYQVQFFPPTSYQATTEDSWALVVSGGVALPVSFGAEYVEGGQPAADAAQPDAEAEVAEADAAAPAAETADESVDTAVDAAEDAAAEGGLVSNIGMIIIGAAVVLVLLAIVGVVLLRRA